MRRIEIYDTTLRDGAQGEGISFSLPDKLALTQRLDNIGFDYVEGGYPASNEKDFQYFQRVGQLGLKQAKVCAFGMTRRKGGKAETDAGLKALLDSGAAVITLVGKASAFQATEVLRTTLDENLAMIRDSVAYLVRAGREVIFDAEHFYDGWKQDRDYALLAVAAAAEAGARLVMLCDTNGGSMPDEVAADHGRRDRRAARAGGHPFPQRLRPGRGQLAGRRRGRGRAVQGTINGFGERCGNADLISVIANLAVKKQGYELLQPGGVDRLTELSRYVYETGEHELPREPAVCGQERLRPQGRDARQRHRPHHGQLRAHRPATGGQRAAGAGERAVGPVEHRRHDRPAQHPRRPEADGPDSGQGGVDGERRLPVRGGRRLVRLLVQGAWTRSGRISSRCTTT